ncbi:transglycosylase SLT domain-containing protein, partial [Limnohabitans sp.]|uniref:transglycosylase SLT domain-containing protein n=1 Tax=Limnohabitans sp. TaxID=1907725 RepID=UPI003918F043
PALPMTLRPPMMMPPLFRRIVRTLHTLGGDVREGFVEITRHSLALLGLGLVALALTFGLRPDLQQSASTWLIESLRDKLPEVVPLPSTPDPAELSTARHLRTLEPEQAALAYALRSRFKVAAEPLAALITEAMALEQSLAVPATVLLSVAAVSSRFNPFAMGSGPYRGLMQLDPGEHVQALERRGGPLSVYDPRTSMQLAAHKLSWLMAEHGSLESALILYGEAAGQASGSAFAQKVQTERQRMESALQQRRKPTGG